MILGKWEQFEKLRFMEREELESPRLRPICLRHSPEKAIGLCRLDVIQRLTPPKI